MSIVPSLLQAIVQVDGEALVMHAGDKPYVVAANGQVDLAASGLERDAVNGIVAQLLPADLQRALNEFGAARYELPPSPQFPGEHFTVVAARGGDEVWAEIRRRRLFAIDRGVREDMVRAATHSAPALATDRAMACRTTRAPARGDAEHPSDDVSLPDAASPPPAAGVVVPIARHATRPDAPPPLGGRTYSGLDRLLRVASARGASALYLASDARPSIRVDGEMHPFEGEPVLTAADVESLLLTLMPERGHEALRNGAATEWISEIDDVGRARCLCFRDQRGPGGVFRLMAGRPVSTEQLGLSREIQALALEPAGLVLVVGPRSSGKRTLRSAFVDLMNRTRPDHVITIEREINIVHDRGTSFISQREVRGGNEELLAAAHAALREDPDVLVIDELKTRALVDVALEAAAMGHLVIGGFSAHCATEAVDRIIDLYAPENRRQVQMAIADHLRGIVVQVLLRKTGGGRLAARELLLNTPAVAGVIAEGKTSQLPMAIEGGRRHGMVPLNDALVGFVQSGAVDPREAYRRAPDRSGFVTVLKRQGLDTSFVERLA